LDKIKRIGKHCLYAVITNIIFGIIYYLVFSWLIGYSLLYAYAGSLTLIAVGLMLDRYMINALASNSTIIELKKLSKEDRETNYRLIQWLMDSFVSFKTILFVFYFFILIVSQVMNMDPTLIGENLREFIVANSYGIVLLIAIDMISRQFSKDRKDMKRNSEILRRSLEEDEV